MKKHYMATSNGDFNQEITEVDTVKWELEEGCQNYAIVTKKKLTDGEYTAISRILDRA